MKQEVLIITSYFPPEIGAASNRIFQLANGLQEQDFKVRVLTPLPNYPTGQIFKDYKGKFTHISEENNMTIHRLWIYASNSKNKILRLIAMLSYSFSLVWYFMWHKIPKTVIIQSPPLLVAFTALLFLRRKHRNLILNVSDLWPIAGLELGALKKNFSYRILEKIERYNYKKAHLILGQSEEIIAHVTTIVPEKPTFLYRNYPEFKPPSIPYQTPSGKLKIVYAGLLGIAQGIYKLCNELDYAAIELHIYGSGAEQSKIEAFIAEHPDLPVFFYGRVSREELHELLMGYDVAIIPLLNRIYGSVPSKIFEYARLGLPMLYFGGGEGESVIRTHQLGWVAEAGDYSDLNAVISKIEIGDISEAQKQAIQEVAVSQFDFNSQLQQLVGLI
ncbi:glycosyltransferase family 4 protein [Psychroserpens sp. SPM9]|uniref:glycosyltransferase family 4 protein n=1 Tax=Psychroserpens sp. SPM9 TaxID=2975598 RepID=UPI0021A6B897|nr:glycosyltransferase family 4 protein [Psychroserpens sp. SPM9]MDG5491118.1 glycosyltransferase family 4 protein [Psychroserpens sp. SPM9]